MIQMMMMIKVKHEGRKRTEANNQIEQTHINFFLNVNFIICFLFALCQHLRVNYNIIVPTL